jgi:methyl-accepting chemotaxis protein
MKRLSLQALGGGQSVAIGAIFLLLTVGAMAAIGLFVHSASRDNASAVLHEKAVTELHMLLRGLNEAVVSQGALASLEMVKKAVAAFDNTRARVSAGSDVETLGGFTRVKERITALMNERRNVAFDDDAMIAVGKISTDVEKMIATLTLRSQSERSKAGEAEGLARAVILGATLLVVLGTLAIFVAFHRNVTRPVEEAIGFADQVARGNLVARADTGKEGQAGRLLAALRDMSQSLGRIVAEVRRGTEGIEGASARLADGNEHLSRRTEQQATSLEETAASMEELSSAVAENAESAKLASERAHHARAAAARGGDVIGQFAVRMEAIQAGSRRIAEIIGVIDGIAFQTNILALNAAVEAARAGEEGRGFAVVASEVRALALRSATAAKEIKEVIRESADQISGGSAMVDASRQTMEDIGAAVDQMAGIIGQINLASTEQANGIRQISSVIVQLEQTVQHNATLVGEITTASQGLRNQAGDLKQAVRVFTIDDAGDPARLSQRAPGAPESRAAGLTRHAAGRLALAPEAVAGRGGPGES